MIKLTREQAEAAKQSPQGVSCEDEDTGKMFVLLDIEVHQQLKSDAYRKDIIASVTAGKADVDAGRAIHIEDADAMMREKLNFPPQSNS